MTLNIVSSFNGVSDPDAAAYIEAVEAADGELLEFAVGKAINDFVLGCKADGIWNAIKASCILAGARTLNGALVPLAGTAPTNYNFVAGDYNRKTGLVGDGSTKYLDSNRNNNADPRNSRHLSVYATSVNTLDTVVIAGTSNVTGRTSLVQLRDVSARISSTEALLFISPISSGFMGGSRSDANTVNARNHGITVSGSSASEPPTDVGMGIFANGIGETACNARLAFYSIGEALDLAKLDARVTTLINAFGVAIP